jgi:hypothetical protein
MAIENKIPVFSRDRNSAMYNSGLGKIATANISELAKIKLQKDIVDSQFTSRRNESQKGKLFNKNHAKFSIPKCIN